MNFYKSLKADNKIKKETSRKVKMSSRLSNQKDDTTLSEKKKENKKTKNVALHEFIYISPNLYFVGDCVWDNVSFDFFISRFDG